VNLNATIIAQMLIFGLLIWFTMKVVFPMFMNPAAERSRRIAEGLAAAEQAQRDLAEAEAKVTEIVRDAHTRALAIEHQAQQQANETVEAAKKTAQTEGQRLLIAARDQITLETQKARDELRGQVGALAVAGATRIIGREINARDHAELLEKLAAEV
jgi:F-type H+-transporting ATPase subunit b